MDYGENSMKATPPLELGIHSVRNYLKLACEYELRILTDTKVSAAMDYGENSMKVTPPLELCIHSVRNYLKLTCEYELHILTDTKVSAAMDYDENSMKVTPPLIGQLLCNHLIVKRKKMA